ncbi:MAG TPA: DUF5658 family protein [Phycisphaerales bacterium]|nr:DUF5658 family protein [Phycisphaerales bacterium]
MSIYASHPLVVAALRQRSGILERAATPEATACRVSLLILAITMMGAVDLWCSWTYMSTIGMFELNPLARWMIELGGPSLLVIFKFTTMLFAALGLFIARRHRHAEGCAWLGFGILLALMVQWTHYNATLPSLTHDILQLAAANPSEPPSEWIKFGM